MKANEIIRDRYQLLRPLGSGGFGEVWLAKDQMTGTHCAIKFYVRLDDAGRSEFRGEYSRMLGIRHPNLLTASYYDEWQGRPFLVMDYCGGGAASGKVGQLDETELWRLIRDVASGLACLHSQCDARSKEAPVIHQDIKPANFLQKGDGTWLISDFGISSRMRSSMSSQSGREVSSGGTIPYMGPERFGQDRILVKASDIWSIGASIYEMATGQLPFNEELGGFLQKKGEEIPHLPKERWSPDLDRLVSSCLQKETWDRPSAALVAEYADCKLKGKPLPRLPKETPPLPKPKPKLWKWMAAAGAVVAVVLAIVLWPESSDTQAYKACRTVADYRSYISSFGTNSLHYAEAKRFVDDHVADSTAQAQQQLAQQQAQQQAEAEAKAQAEAERKEEASYGKCTTVSGCNSYLKTYPNGKYVEEVRAKKAELEQQAWERDKPSSPANTSVKPQGAVAKQQVDKGVAESVFSVGSSKQVVFAKGNLQFRSSTGSWRFANNQWETIGQSNTHTSSSYNDWIDLFSWSMINRPDIYTKDNTSNDWSTHVGAGWRLPSKDEWYYLFNGRHGAHNKYGAAQVNGVTGIVVLPDEWSQPDGVNFSASKYYSTNTYDMASWRKMEEAGAIFLPAAGRLTNKKLYRYGTDGMYWSSTSKANTERAYNINFELNVLECELKIFESNDDSMMEHGFAVRLVKNK